MTDTLRKFRIQSTLARALLICLAALGLRVVYYVTISDTACLAINLDPVSDMEAFHRWASAIVEGDWLDRQNFHPFHPWQAAVASRNQWETWYGEVFHQEPLYPYLIAVLYLAAPAEPTTVILFQLLMGAGGCGFVYLAGRRLMPEGAAVLAGVLSASYGPYLYYESLVLRDSILIPLNALLLWVLLEARFRSRQRAAHAWWAGAGMLLGLLYITKVSVLPFFIAIGAWSVWETRHLPLARRLTPVCIMLACLIVMVSPVALRNLAVGAPAMEITTRGPIEFINGNNRWHRGIGWFDGSDRRISSYARETLAAADGGLLLTVARVMGDWSADLPGLVVLQIRKTGFLLAPFEMPNNASYSYFRENSVLLRFATLSFYWISPLALLGLILSVRRWSDFMTLYLFLAVGSAVTIAFYVIARFRAPLVPGLMLFAGFGLWSILAQARSGRGWWAAVSCLIVLGGFMVNTATTYADRDLTRPQDYFIAMKAYRSRGRPIEAIEQAERGRALFPGFSEFAREAGELYLEQDRRREALLAFREVLARNPGDAEIRERVKVLEREIAP